MSKLENKMWEEILTNLSEIINISPDILDFLSSYDIILSSISGYSVQDISMNFEIDIEDVKSVLRDTIGVSCWGWDGFTESSLINPYFVFKTLTKEFGHIPTESDFSEHMQKLTGNATFSGESFENLYSIILIFCTLRFKYLDKYRKEDYGNYISRNT